MKKILVAIACMVVGVSLFAQVAAQKEMKYSGPAGLQLVANGTLTGALIDFAMFNGDVLGVYPGTTNLGFVYIKPNTEVSRNKVFVAWMPKGFNADGSTWDYATDCAATGDVEIIGFKSKNVFLLVTFNDGSQRIYSVTMKAGKASSDVTSYQVIADKDMSGKDSKVNGSTAAIANYQDGSVASNKCYVYEDANLGQPNRTITEYDKKCQAKKNATVNGDVGGVVLPTEKDKYSYDVDTASGLAIEITTAK